MQYNIIIKTKQEREEHDNEKLGVFWNDTFEIVDYEFC